MASIRCRALSVLVTVVALVAATLTALVVSPGVAHALTPTVPADPGDIHISEVFADGAAATGTDATFPHDFIELTNTGAQTEDVSGWILKDDTDSHAFTLDDGSTIDPGGYLAINVDDSAHSGHFGIGNTGDAARLYESDGTTLVDQFWFSAAAGDGNDFDRCPIGSNAYAIVLGSAITPGASNTCPDASAALTTVKSQLKVNEVMTSNANGNDGKQGPDWIELTDTGTTSVDLDGWWLSDDDPADKDVFPADTVIKPGAFAAYGVGGSKSTDSFPGVQLLWGATKTGSDFALSASGDNAALVAPDGSDADRVSFGTDTASQVAEPATGNTISSCPDGTDTWKLSYRATAAATNVCANPADSIVKVNEVDLANGVVELANTSATTAVDVSGFTLSDGAAQSLTLATANTTVGGSPGTSIPASGFAEVALGSVAPAAAGDTVTLTDGSAEVDTASWSSAFTPSLGRCPDGSGAFTSTTAVTDGAAGSTAGANACPAVAPSGYDGVRISEIETNGDENGDWIELTNVGAEAVNISGMYLADNGGNNGPVATFPTDSSHYWQIPGANHDVHDTTTAGNVVLPAGGYLAYYDSQFGFGLGQTDQARVFDPDKTLVDATAWTAHEAGVTYERCPSGTAGQVFTDTADSAPFVNSWRNSPGAANDCTPPIRINEVQANDVDSSDSTGGLDWVELTNVGSQPVDITGYTLADDSDGTQAKPHEVVIGDDYGKSPTGLVNGSPIAADVTTLAPGAFARYLVSDAARPGNFGLGGSGDEVRLYLPGAYDSGTGSYDNADLADSFVYETPANATAPEAKNLTQDVTLAGAWPQDPNGAPVTYARCLGPSGSRIVADGTGSWNYTYEQTPGAANQCVSDTMSLVTSAAWPDTTNAQAVTTADNTDLGQNVSGLFYQPGATPAGDTMWAIQNGSSGLSGANAGDPGSLYKLVPDNAGKWGPAAGWEKGVPVRYPSGQGEPDSEGVTAVDGKVYVASERDNTNSDVSKIAVLQVDPGSITTGTGDADGDLVAGHEWDLTDLMPPAGGGVNTETGLDSSKPGDANLGIEGVTFIPDSYLTSVDFRDDSTGQAYEPSQYPKHVAGGVFVVGLEKTGDLYAYVFNSDDTVQRIATIPSGFFTVQEVQWDPSRQALLAVCDNGCQGRSSVLQIDQNTDADEGTFQITAAYQRPSGATDNLNNEGFTLQPASECTNGTKTAFWSDDSDDGGHWLRSASVDCNDGTGATGVTITPNVSGTPSSSGWYNAPVTVSFTCTDVDAVLTAACPSPVPVSSTTAAQTIGTRTDTLGRVYDVDLPNIKIDTTPPSAADVTVTGPTGWQHTRTAAFTFSSSESDVTGFQCKLSGVDTVYQACASPYSRTGLADGSYTLSVRAVDQADNVSDPVSAQDFEVDTVKPTVQIHNVTKGATYLGAGPQPKCVGSDAASGLKSCQLRITRTLTAVRVVATATDKAGNSAGTSLSYNTVPDYLAGATYKNGSFTVRTGHTYSVYALRTKRAAVRLVGPVRSGHKFTGAGTPMKYVRKVDGFYEYRASRKVSIGSGSWQLGVRQGGRTAAIRIHR